MDLMVGPAKKVAELFTFFYAEIFPNVNFLHRLYPGERISILKWVPAPKLSLKL